MNNLPGVIPDWVHWGQRLQALAQTGLTFARDPFDLERYEELRRIAAQMIATQTQTPLPAVARWLEGDTGYATPKVDVRGVLFRAGKILLVRERADDGWTLPGGWADVGSSPAENVEREILEEAGVRARATKLLAVLDRAKHPHDPPFPFHVYKMFFRCEIVAGEPRPSHEISAVDFFSPTDLPPLSTSRITPGQLQRMFYHAQHPDAPPDFDPTSPAM